MKRLKLLLLASLYLAAILCAYRFLISPTYEYQGYHCIWPSPFEVLWLVIFSLLPIAFLPLNLRRPSSLIVWWLYVTVFISATWLPALSLTMPFGKLLPLQLATLAGLGLLTLCSSAKVLKIRPVAVSQRTFWWVLLFIWSACLTFFCAHFSLQSLVANLAGLFLGGSEYIIRADFFQEVSEAGRLLSYSGGLASEALDPFLIAYGLVYRKKWCIALGVFGQLMFFAVVGGKSILFSTLFLVLVLYLVRRFRRNFGFTLISVLIAVVLIAAAVDSLDGNVVLTTLSTRRTLIDPGLLTGFYYEHYSNAPHAGIAYHFPSGGEALPAPSYEIGLIYFGDEKIDANANLWAEGFADFGISGVLGFSLLLALMMWLYDSIAARKNFELGVLAIGIQAFAFSNSAPLTVAITHGGVAVALLIWCVPAPALEPVEEFDYETGNEAFEAVPLEA